MKHSFDPALIVIFTLQAAACYTVAPAEGDDGFTDAPDVPYGDVDLDVPQPDVDVPPEAVCTPGVLRKVGSDMRITGENPNSMARILIEWTGTEFAMAWSGGMQGLKFTRISPAGERIGDSIVEVQEGSASHPDLAWTGSELGLAWSAHTFEGTPSYEIFFARLSPAGEKIGGDVRITDMPGESTFPRLEWTGTEYGLAWSDQITLNGHFQVLFTRISPQGEKIGGDVQVSFPESSGGEPSLQWTGSEFGLVWRGGPLYFTRLSPTGERLGAEDTLLTESVTDLSSPAMSWTGSGFGIAWADRSNIDMFFTLISPEGDIIVADAAATDVAATSPDQPSLQWTGTEFGLAWLDFRNSTTDYVEDIYFTLISASGEKIGNDLLVSDISDLSIDPTLEWTGTDFGVAWVDIVDIAEGGDNMSFARIGWCE